jgi:hypothetical protein
MAEAVGGVHQGGQGIGELKATCMNMESRSSSCRSLRRRRPSTRSSTFKMSLLLDDRDPTALLVSDAQATMTDVALYYTFSILREDYQGLAGSINWLSRCSSVWHSSLIASHAELELVSTEWDEEQACFANRSAAYSARARVKENIVIPMHSFYGPCLTTALTHAASLYPVIKSVHFCHSIAASDPHL